MFKNLYDTIRIIDPINKQTIITKNDNIKTVKSNCYDFWKNKSSCKNCISMRAYIHQDTFTKFEYNDGKIFFVIATPIKFHKKEYVVEMIKEIFIEDLNIHGKGDLRELINNLNEKIVIDDLTNIYNRRYISERLPMDINNSIKIKKPLTIVIADVDSFKKVNDAYGHVMGDIVLKDTSKLIKDCLSKSEDWVGRYGGDEFIIVLYNTDRKDVFKTVENIRAKIEDHKFNYIGKSINVTLSLGVCTVNSYADFDRIMEMLDENLYKAKKNGKNSIVADIQYIKFIGNKFSIGTLGIFK